MNVRISVALISAATALVASALAVGPALASSHASGSGEITGPELISGTVHGKAALANTTKIPLVWQGLISTHSVVTLGGGGGPHKGAVKTLPSPAGNLTVMVSKAPAHSRSLNTPTCRITFVQDIPVTVVGSKSTGAFADASGPGAAQLSFAATASRYKTGPKKGQCNPNGRPVAKTAVASFLASAVLTTG